MAIDVNFLLFALPVLYIVLAVVVALPSRKRIMRDPSTAYTGGKRAMVLSSVAVGVFLGLVLAAFGGTLELKSVLGGANMVQLGGASLLGLAVLVALASWYVRREIKRASAGTHEDVLDVVGYQVPEGGPVAIGPAAVGLAPAQASPPPLSEGTWQEPPGRPPAPPPAQHF